ncbi:hypothetical protein [Pelagicoccus sp. SDUM812005]|uniref:hypothetical protein n=1 Tax=Pelagicoccus sp. SDUM812005 TaxID=3041257 RepID=UPI00280EAB3D|nr:hypothetical protein [Pelagicoccus sp. SDUM812005]MDQ8180366.1 hypothetical protein [Pelagicoccus sp. SDUM812005]
MPTNLSAGLDEMVARHGVGKSLILRQTLGALLESVPAGRVCRLDTTDLTGPDLISVQLDENFVGRLVERFPSKVPGEILKFAACLAGEVFGSEEQLCLPLGLSLLWPKSGEFVGVRNFAAVVPGVGLASLVGSEVFVRGKPSGRSWRSRKPPLFDMEGKAVKGYLRPGNR